MTEFSVRGRLLRVIAALHLPPVRCAAQPAGASVSQAIQYAVRNAALALENGVDAVYVQDLGDHPSARQVQPHTIARVTAVGCALRQAFPEAVLGVCLMAHGAQGPLAVAEAMNADLVRLKVFVGAMVKAEGILEGCAYEAVEYRARLVAPHIRILADIYDRTGMPIAPVPVEEAAQMAATFGSADGLILTGRSVAESMAMVEQVRSARLNVPLLIGGGVDVDSIGDALGVADAVIVSTALKRTASWSSEALSSDWDLEKVRALVAAADGG